MNKVTLSILAVTAVFFTSCYYDNFKELHPDVAVTNTSGCDTTTGIKYSVDIAPIFTTYCIGCHSSGAIHPLTSVATIKASYSSTALYTAVSSSVAPKPMPQGGPPLSATSIAKIKLWIDACQPNN